MKRIKIINLGYCFSNTKFKGNVSKTALRIDVSILEVKWFMRWSNDFLVDGFVWKRPISSSGIFLSYTGAS